MSQLRGFSLWEKTPPWIRRGWGFSQGLSLSWGALKCKSTCKPLRACPFPPPFPLPSSPFLPTSITSSSSSSYHVQISAECTEHQARPGNRALSPYNDALDLLSTCKTEAPNPSDSSTPVTTPCSPHPQCFSALLNLTTRFPHKRNCVVFMLCDCFRSVCVEYTPGAC